MEIKRITKSNEEYDELRALWCKVFGDEPSYVDALYEALDAEGWIGLVDGRVVSALTTYDAGVVAEYENDSAEQHKASVVYAVCTDEQYRGNGYAAELVKAAIEAIHSAGNIALTSPAEPSLQAYYEKLGFNQKLLATEKMLYLEEEESFDEDDFDEEELDGYDFDEEGIFVPSLKMSVECIDAKRYGELREQFLSELERPLESPRIDSSQDRAALLAHIKLSDRFLDFVQSESHDGNGLLLINGGDAICALYGFASVEEQEIDSQQATQTAPINDTLQLAELIVNPQLLALSSEIDEQIAIALAELFETESIKYRMPSETRAREQYLRASDLEAPHSADTYVQSLVSGNVALDGAYFGFPID